MVEDGRVTTVLVVEEEGRTARQLMHELQPLGFQFRVAVDVAMAAEMVASSPIDAILVDLDAPDLDILGLPALSSGSDLGRELPLVFTGANVQGGSDELASDFEHRAFIFKPVAPQELKNVVEGLLASLSWGAQAKRAERSGRPRREEGWTPLRPRAVASILLDLERQRASGFLTLSHGDAEIIITVVRGTLVNAKSSLRQHTFGRYLVDRGILAEAQYLEISQTMRDEGQRFGEAAVKLGHLKPTETVDLLRGAAIARIAQGVTWSQGDMQFAADRSFAEADVLTHIEASEAILLGFLGHCEITEVVAEFVGQRHRFICPTPRFRLLQSFLRRLVPNSRVAEQITRYPTLEDLSQAIRAAGVPVLKELYALWAAGLIEFLDTPPRAGAPLAGGAASLSPADARRDTEAVRALPDGAAPEPWIDIDVDLLTLPGEPAGLPRPSDAEPDIVVDEGEEYVNNEFLRLQGADYYTVLGVASTASAEEVQRAAQQKMESLPSLDATAGANPKIRQRWEEIDRWIRKAKDALCDPVQRSVYDEELGKHRVMAPCGLTEPEGEDAYQKGLLALTRGDVETAVTKLRVALARCPGDPDYAAVLGWAETRRAQADAEAGYKRLLLTCERNPRVARVHYYLGLVEEERNNLDGARQSLQQAVALDPALKEAQEALARVSSGEQSLFGALFGGSVLTSKKSSKKG